MFERIFPFRPAFGPKEVVYRLGFFRFLVGSDNLTGINFDLEDTVHQKSFLMHDPKSFNEREAMVVNNDVVIPSSELGIVTKASVLAADATPQMSFGANIRPAINLAHGLEDGEVL